MTSPLFSLGNCLNELESKFCDAIMESLLRLSSLTDANVFLVVETPQGKRFCGKDRLCRSFAEGKLTFDSEKDIEMRLSCEEVGLTAVRRPDLRPADSQSDDSQTKPAQRTYSKFQTPARVSDLDPSFNILSDNVSSIGDSSSVMSANTLKRRLSSIGHDQSSTPKSTKTNLQANPFKIEPWDNSLLGLDHSISSRVGNDAPPTSGNLTSPSFSDAAPSTSGDESALQSCIRALQSESDRGSSSSIVKNEIVLMDSDDEEAPLPSRAQSERQEDASFELGRQVYSDSNWSLGTTIKVHPSTSINGKDIADPDYAPSIDDSLQLDEDASDNSFYSFYSSPSVSCTSVVPAYHNGSQSSAIYAAVSPDDLPEVRASLRRYLEEDMKAIAVCGYRPEDLLVKESAGYKILSSLLYDVGKKYGTQSIGNGLAPPETDSLRCFYVCFDEFCSYFPNLSSVFNHKLVIGKKKSGEGPAFAADNRTFKTFMRSKMQRTFGRYSKRHT